MVYQTLKYEQTVAGLMLPIRPKERQALVNIPGEIIFAGYHSPTVMKLVRESSEMGLLLVFNSRDYKHWQPRLKISETSDLVHLVKVFKIEEDNDWSTFCERDVVLHAHSEGNIPKLFGFSFENYKF